MTREQMITSLQEVDRLINRNEAAIRIMEAEGMIRSSHKPRLSKRNRLAALARYWETALARKDNPMSIAEETAMMMQKIHNKIYST